MAENLINAAPVTADEVEMLGIESESHQLFAEEYRLRAEVKGEEDTLIYQAVRYPLDDADRTLCFADGKYRAENMEEQEKMFAKVYCAVNYFTVKGMIDGAEAAHELDVPYVSLHELWEPGDLTEQQREELWKLLEEREKDLAASADEMAWEIGSCMKPLGYFATHRTDGGWDWTLYGPDYAEIDGGVLENEELTADGVAEDVLPDYGFPAEPEMRRAVNPQGLEESVRITEEACIRKTLVAGMETAGIAEKQP